MTNEDQLINIIERMGYGVDVNYMTGKVIVELPDRRKRTFAGIDAALEFMRERERAVRSFG